MSKSVRCSLCGGSSGLFGEDTCVTLLVNATMFCGLDLIVHVDIGHVVTFSVVREMVLGLDF